MTDKLNPLGLATWTRKVADEDGLWLETLVLDEVIKREKLAGPSLPTGVSPQERPE